MTDLVLSPSRGSKYEQCPQAYKLHYHDKVPQVPSVSTIGGNAFHDWVEAYEVDALYGTDSLMDFASYFWARVEEQEEKSQLDRLFFKATGRKTKALPNGEDLDYWANTLGPDLCAQYEAFDWGDWEIATDLPPDADGKTIGLEYHLVIPELWQGFVDRIDVIDVAGLKVYRSVDYKTGTRMWTSTQNDEYGAALTLHGIRIGYTATYNARKTELKQTPKRWDALTFLELESQRRTGIEAGYFPPRVGEHCGWCKVADHCQFRPVKF